MQRRDFIAGAAASAAFWSGVAKAASPLDGIPIIDAHMHLFDATRPQGAPYTGSRFYKGGVSLPAMYDKQAAAAGIVGAMAMEASQWLEDNLWLAEQVQTDTLFVGMVGMLEPDKADFAETLDRFRKHRLFRGIRYGKLWGFNISTKRNDPAFLAGLKHLADVGLPLDTANVDLDLLQTVVALNDKVPGLRIVLDHMPAYVPKPAEAADYAAVMKEIGTRPNISAKISWNFITPNEMDKAANGELTPKLSGYREKLDYLTGIFGEDRVIFNTNYPQTVGQLVTKVSDITALTKAYYATKPRAAAEKFFWKNSLALYKWVKRAPGQPGPG
jgi:predicted TIM-barrel fold metal-dependent hydrolase